MDSRRDPPRISELGDLADDALAVIEASQADRVVLVAMSHAGWVAIELRRRLGARIPKLVLLDWIVLEAPPPFLTVLQALQDPAEWQQTREQLFCGFRDRTFRR
jgi:pimeloyl-ACP methyl ester carboxylesterase